MKDKSKKILLIILIFLIIPHTYTSADLIIPKKKPDIAKENIKKNKISNFLIPLKKPSQKQTDINTYTLAAHYEFHDYPFQLSG